MKIQLLSDLHLEFYRDPHAFIEERVPNVKADVLVLAGDVFSLRRHDTAELCDLIDHFYERAREIVYVPGNHEFYGLPRAEGASIVSSVLAPRMHVLTPDVESIYVEGNHRFIGGTLWFPRKDDNEFFEHMVNDFAMIRGDFLDWVYAEHERTKRFLDENLLPGDIVVTHHLPSKLSVPALYKTSESNRFFVGDSEDLMKKHRPALWLHGHTHGACDYRFEGTRVICNPGGYPRTSLYPAERTDWNPGLVIEL